MNHPGGSCSILCSSGGSAGGAGQLVATVCTMGCGAGAVLGVAQAPRQSAHGSSRLGVLHPARRDRGRADAIDFCGTLILPFLKRQSLGLQTNGQQRDFFLAPLPLVGPARLDAGDVLLRHQHAVGDPAARRQAGGEGNR